MNHPPLGCFSWSIQWIPALAKARSPRAVCRSCSAPLVDHHTSTSCPHRLVRCELTHQLTRFIGVWRYKPWDRHRHPVPSQAVKCLTEECWILLWPV
eukprot:2032040-Rhodomonas_salina.2